MDDAHRNDIIAVRVKTEDITPAETTSTARTRRLCESFRNSALKLDFDPVQSRTTSKCHPLKTELEGVCGEIAASSTQWARSVRFASLSYEEAFQRADIQAWLASWMTLAQNAALGTHTLILEDGPEIPPCSKEEEIIAESMDEERGTFFKECVLLAVFRWKTRGSRKIKQCHYAGKEWQEAWLQRWGRGESNPCQQCSNGTDTCQHDYYQRQHHG
jgi:hypothetical protein